MFIIFLLCWGLALAVVAVKFKNIFNKPIFWLGMADVLIVGLFYTCGFTYEFPLKIYGLVYFVGLFVMFAAGYLLSARYSFRLRPSVCAGGEQDLRQQENVFDNRLNRTVWFIIAAAGFIIFTVDFFINNSLGDADLHVNSEISTLGVLGKIMLLSGLIVWLNDCVYAITNNKMIPLTAFAAAGMYMVPALLTSGRQSMIIFITATASALLFSFAQVGKYKYRKHLLILVAAAFLLLVVFCVYVAVNRQVTDDKVQIFEKMFACKVSPSTVKLLNKTGFLKSLLLEVVSYYSHELPMFQLFFDNWSGPLFLGASQFTLISQNLPAGSPFNYSSMWTLLQNIADANGVYSHTWRSSAANLIIDFGFVGAMFAALAVGYVAGRIYRRTTTRRRTYDIVLLAMVNSGLFFSMQYSPVCEGYWFYPMLWLCIGFPLIKQAVRAFKHYDFVLREKSNRIK